MFYFILFIFPLFFPFSFSSTPSNLEKCFDNFCFIELRVSEETCPSPYKPLEFHDNQTWESFKQIIKQNPSYSNKTFKLNLILSQVGLEWVDGEKYKTTTGGKIKNQTIYENVVCLKGISFIAQPHNRFLNRWICQVEGCHGDDDSCYEVVDGGENKTWYQAMNDCFEKRKRLAIFKNNQIPQQVSTKIHQSTNQGDGCYWIGLSKNNFKWKSSNQMVTFNNWIYGFPQIITNFCSFVETSSSSFLWNSHNQDYCSSFPPHLMCMRNNKTNNSLNNNDNLQKKKIGLGVGLTIAILFLLILFFLLLFYFLHKKGKFQSCRNKSEKKNTEESIEEVRYCEENHVTKPVYAEVVKNKNNDKIKQTSTTSNLTYVNPSDFNSGE